MYFLDLTGPTSSFAGSTKGYTANWTDGFGNPVSAPASSDYTWTATSGTVSSPGQTTCAVEWTTAGSGKIELDYYTFGNWYYDYVNVTVYGSPVAIAATSMTSSSFTANWNSTSGATSYRLDVSTSSTFSSFVTGYSNISVSGTSRSVTGLAAGTRYYYRIRAVGSPGTSEYSNVISVFTKPPPPAVNAATSVATTSFTANWATATGATSYRIDVSLTSSFIQFVSGFEDLTVNGTSQSVTGVSAGSTYYVRVRAVNGSGTSGNSNTVSVLTRPPAPAAETASEFATTSFAANWNAATSATSYRLDVSTSSSFASFVSGFNNKSVATTTADVTGLTAGTTYYYRIRAVNASGASPNSGTVTTYTLPVAPTVNAGDNVTASSFTASWSGVTGATAYRLDVSTSSSFSTFVSGYNNLSTAGNTSRSVTGLSPGTTYYYRVRATNASGSSANSASESVLTKPAAPAAISATGITTTSFTADWNAVTSATSYRLDVSTSSAFSTFVSGYSNLTVAGTSRGVTGLLAGIKYYYRVRAVNATGVSANSNYVAALTLPPAPVANNPTSMTSTTFTANWSAATGATSYRIDVSASSSFSSFVTGFNNASVTETSTSVTGLASGTTYYYRVRAVNSSGTSANSATESALTRPAAPAATAATSETTTSFTANWNAVTSATSYRLDVSTSSTFGSFVTGYNNVTVSATSKAVTGLTNGTTYYYRVRAVNASGTSSSSNSVSTATLPVAPTANNPSSITTTSFTANWTSVDGATGYRLDVSSNSSFSSFITGYYNATASGTNKSVTGLASGKTYYYRVRAVNAGGASANSATESVITKPLAPEATAATSESTTSFTANWSSVIGASSYRLDVSTSSTFGSFVTGYNNATVSATSKAVTGLSHGTTYYYRVRAANASGTSSNSNTVSTATLPLAPATSNATSITTTTFIANWASVVGATGYRLDVSSSSTFSSFITGYNDDPVSGTNESITGLASGTTYYYRVRAVNAGGTSANSATESVITRPVAPTATAATSETTTSFTANWSAVTGASSYRLDVSTSSTFASFLTGYNNATVSATSKAVTGLPDGTTYYYRVRAANASGTSSNSGTVSTATLPLAPEISNETLVTTTTFTVNWAPATGATSYRLDVSSNSSFSILVTGYNNVYVSGTSMEVSGLSAGKTYYYRVRAVNAGGTSANSLTESVITRPLAPEATAATTETTTSFTANWSSVIGASSYRLDVSTSSTFASLVTGYNNATVPATSASVTGLSDGTTYHYRVRAENDSGPSSSSNTISTATLPLAPEISNATLITTTTFIANWASVTGATSYRLDVSSNSSFSSFITGYNNVTVTGTSMEVTDLASGTTYYYRVRAVNAGGTSANSPTESVITRPLAPEATAATSETTTSFTANWSSVIGASSYRLDVSTSSTFASFLTGYNNTTVSATSKAVTGLSGGITYYYRARAVNDSGPSANSNTISTATELETPLANTPMFTTTITFTANWQPVGNATGYRLDVSTSSTFSSFLSGYNNLVVAGTSQNVSWLSPGTDYYYRVRAVNATGTSSNSNTVHAITLPLAPVALPASAITSDSFTANWTSVASATSYRLDVSTSSAFSSFVTGFNNRSVTGTSHTVSGLAEKTTSYYYRVKAQNDGGPSENSNTILAVDLDQNYVHEIVVLKEGLTTEAQVNSAALGEKLETYNFFDGLGRPSQTVRKQQSPAMLDVVQPVVYDAYGRETVKHLPYVSGNDGWYKVDFIDKGKTSYGSSPQYDFYQEQENVAHDTAPFAETIFEPSPLNRVLKQGAPGLAWQPNSNPADYSDKTIKKQYAFNDSAEVLLWTYSPATHRVTAKENGTLKYYAPNELYANSTFDEHNNRVIEYVDKEGRTVLKRVQAVAGTPATTGIGKDGVYAGTYYIYDDLGNLVTVLSPEATRRLDTEYHDAAPSAQETFLDRWAFRYRYDERRRMVEKQVPGAGPVYMVYDRRDRLVLTQDGNQREKHQWLFTKYDTLNRPIVTGIYNHGDTISRDNISALVDTNRFCESYNGLASFHGYTNAVFPTANLDVLTVTYYDDYRFRDDLAGVDYIYDPAALTGLPSSSFTRVKGQVTGAKTRVLGTPDFLWSASYYDDKYRAIQTVTDNQQGGLDRTSTIYDFTGKVLNTVTTHGDALAVTERFEYDHAGRLLKTYHRVGAEGEVLLAESIYNELGELVTKNLHSHAAGFRQQVDYRYNIRGWLDRINHSDLSIITDGGPRDLFGMELGYNESLGIGTAAAQFNGNISAMKWSTNLGLDNGKGDLGYKFVYDPMNRLREANHAEKNTTWASSASFAEIIPGYDLNGNIQYLNRTGTGGSNMDDLSYTYTGNQLTAVADAGIDTVGFKDGSTGTDYAYDDNGNLVLDNNKGIDSIAYNHLNLPALVHKSGGEYLTYTYDATGRKLSQAVFNSLGVLQKETDYAGAFFYENDTLKFINHAEGRVVMTGTAAEYQYHLKDHLGNVRLTFTTKEEVDIFQTDFETPDQPEFLNYSHNLFDLFDHTDASTTYQYSQLLNGGHNSQVGLAKSISVMPGDTIKVEVYAKYWNAGSTNGTLSEFGTALTTAFGLSDGMPGEAALAYNALNDYGALVAGGFDHSDDSGAPKAYLNILVFDRHHNFIDAAYKQIGANDAQTTAPPAKDPHGYLTRDVYIAQAGYVYIFLSNENPTQVDVYFDDMKVSHVKSPVVQMDDYYPFGLTFNSYKRENSVENKIKFQGQEHIDDLGLNWDSFKWRNHQPDIGRFFGLDPLAEKYYYNSPYVFSENKVVAHVELEGLESVNFMVAKFTPGETQYRSPEQAIQNPSKPKNQTFGQVSEFTSKESLSFNVDLKTGANSVNESSTHDLDKNFISEAIDAFKGESGKLDYELSVEVKDGTFQIKGTVDGSDFAIKGNVTEDRINMTSQMSNVPENDGAVIKAGSGDFQNATNIMSIKQGDAGDSGKQKSSLSYFVSSGKTYIEPNDSNKKTPTKKSN